MQRVLPGGGVEGEHGVVRRVRVLLGDHAGDLGELVHQVGLVVQPPGRVDQQYVDTVPDRLPVGVEDKAGGVRPGGPGHNRRADPFAPQLQLLHRRRAEGVARRQQHGPPLGAEGVGELADRRRLAGAVHAHHQNDMGLARRIGHERAGHRLQQAGDFLRQHAAHFLARHLLAEACLRQTGCQARGGGRPEVRHDEQVFQLLQRVTVQPAPVEDARNPVCKAV